MANKKAGISRFSWKFRQSFGRLATKIWCAVFFDIFLDAWGLRIRAKLTDWRGTKHKSTGISLLAVVVVLPKQLVFMFSSCFFL